MRWPKIVLPSLLLLLCSPALLAQPNILVPSASGMYGAHPHEQYELYLPPSPVKTRAVAVFHPGVGGGPSQVATLSTVNHIAQLMLVNGIAIFSIGTPQVNDGNLFPIQVNSAAHAVQMLRANASAFGVSDDRLIYWGTSFGAFVMGVLAYGPDYADPNGDAQQKLSTRPFAFIDQRGPSSFVIMDGSAYGGWFGKTTLASVDPTILKQASFAELVLSNAANRTYTPPAIAYYAQATGSPWKPPYPKPTNPHDYAFMDYFMQAISVYAFFHGDENAWSKSMSLLNTNPTPTVNTTDDELIVAHLLKMLGVDEALSVGYSLAGSQGVPELTVKGSVTANSTVHLECRAAKSAPLLLMLTVGAMQINQPIPCGGVFVPSPSLSYFVPTNSSGQLDLPISLPASTTPGSAVYMQFLHPDSGKCNFAASNGVKVFVQ